MAAAARPLHVRAKSSRIAPRRRKLPAGAILRLFECSARWQDNFGAGVLEGEALAKCVANELSAAYLPTCARASSSIVSGYESQILKLKNGTLGFLLVGSGVRIVGAFPHDADGIGQHGCMRHAKCNATLTGWTPRVYARARFANARANCRKGLDSWQSHRLFVRRSTKTTNCVHGTRQAAERYQLAYLDLLERTPLPRRCSAGPLWNQLMVRWTFTDIVGVVHSVDAARAATLVQDVIRRFDETFSIKRPLLRMYAV